MAEDAPPPPEDATLKRKDPPVEDDDSDEEEAAARARRPRGARSAVRPGVECPYMDTISRQVRAGCVCVERLPHATDAWGSAGGSAQPCLSTISFSALTCCGPSPARSATEGVRPCRMGRSTLRWPSRTGRAWLCQPGVWCQQRRGRTHTAGTPSDRRRPCVAYPIRARASLHSAHDTLTLPTNEP